MRNDATTPAAADTNIAAALPRMAAQQPDAMAIAWPDGKGGYEQRTFRELDEDSAQLAAALTAYGIGRGTRTVLMVPPGRDLFALVFALFKAGAVPVLVDPGMGTASLKTCLAEAEPEAFIGIPKAHVARILLGWAKSSLKRRVTVGRRLFWGGTTVAKLRARRGKGLAPLAMGPDEMAAILFTSGSTGVPKGAVYTHGTFLAQVEQLRSTYDIRPGEVDLPTFPLFALFDPALGMSAVIPEMDPTRPADVDPTKILSAVERFSVTNMFGSPALLHRVGAYGAKHDATMPSVKRVVSAGAPVSAEVIAQFVRMLPRGAQVHTPYGATESLPVSTIGSDEILQETGAQAARGRGVCIGRPVSGIEVRIIGIDDGAIPRWDDRRELPIGEIGEIVVRGPVVTKRYYGRREATNLAKIQDADGSFWHRMGDVGYWDDEGRLWFCGRKAHRVQTPSGTLFTVPVEGVFNAHEDVYRTALVGVPDGRTIRPVLCVERHPGRGADTQRLKRELGMLGAKHALTADIHTFLFHDAFPVDIRHNAKIFREKLAVWAAEQPA
jgi:acyl-CoA synthetase (AMP-forming)/AMP-acid ligase II